MTWEVLDISVIGFYSLVNSNSLESIGLLVATIIPVITELWYNNSQLFGLLYTLIYVGAVVILFIFVLSVINEKEEYEYEYSGLFIILLILLFDGIDDNDNNDNDIINNDITDWSDWLMYNNVSDLNIIGNLLFTEYSIVILIISLILLMSIIGLIAIVNNKNITLK